jgi:hypothetical protein
MSFIASVVIGVAVWCAAGQVTVAAPDEATRRLAVGAPWWVAAAAAALAYAVPAWRRRPALATPALLSTLPWWPVPLPPIALLWTGPFAWAPIGLALIAAMADAWTRRSGIGPAALAPGSVAPARMAALAFAATLAAGVLTVWSINPRLPGGDEPNYLVITQSLLKDGDLKIENNFANRDYAEYFGGTLKPDVIQRGKNGEIYSIHAPGVSAIVAPAFWLSGLRGAQGTLVLLAALAGALIWWTGWRVTRSAGAAWFAWAAVAGSATFLLQSGTVYPDGPGLLAVAAAIWLLADRAGAAGRRTTWSLAAVSAGLAALPWLHTRFAVLAAGFGAVILWRLLTDATRAMAARRRVAAVFLVIPIVAAIGWFAYFKIIYGTFNPAAPYGPNPGNSLGYVPGGLLALLFDQQYGLVAYAPVLAFAGLELVRRHRGASGGFPMVTTVAIAAAYLAASTTYWMWWVGNPATPARLATAMLPVLAVPLALGWARASATGRLMRALALGASLATSALIIAVARGDLAWNVYSAHARWLEWLAPVVNLPRGWPSFFWDLTPGVVSTELPFVVHVAVWGVVIGAVSLAVSAWLNPQSVPPSGGARFARTFGEAGVVWSAAILAMLLVQAGWWLNRTHGLDPARSQLDVLREMSRRGSALALGPLSIQPVSDPRGLVRIRGEQPAVHIERPWAYFAGIPAGEYGVQIETARPLAGDLTLSIGRAPVPFRVQRLSSLSRQLFTLSLPAGAAALLFQPRPPLAAIRGDVELAPVSFDRSDLRPALVGSHYGATDTFFLDDGAYVEESGFWVKGGRTAEVVLAVAGGQTVNVLIRNGAVANKVDLEATNGRESLTLAPGEERAVSLQATAGVVRLKITSASGFRPSEQGGRDTRTLGVWIEPK